MAAAGNSGNPRPPRPPYVGAPGNPITTGGAWTNAKGNKTNQLRQIGKRISGE